MEANRLSVNKVKKIKRKEVLEKKKAVDEIIKAASAVNDHLTFYPPFRQFDRNGLSVYLESGQGDQLSKPMKCYIKGLLKENMEVPYGSEWPNEEKIKHREMVAPEARYIIAHVASTMAFPVRIEEDSSRTKWKCDGDRVVGFVHYRFTVEEYVPVIYVYELQLETSVQGKGLGKFLMQLIELIAHKNHMEAVMLTVQKTNLLAMKFYTKKLGYVISTISPSRVDPLIGTERNYEIICKTFAQEAKTKLEDN